jgi:hypothetical protein
VKGKPPFPYPQLAPGQVRLLDELANQLRKLEEQLPRDLAKRLRMFRLPSDHPLLQSVRTHEQQQQQKIEREIERKIKQPRGQQPARQAAHRPPLHFPHLSHALEDLERERKNHPALDKPGRAADFLIRRLKKYGDTVGGEPVGKKHKRTIIRRLKNAGQKSPH